MRIKKVSGTAVLQGNIVDSLNSDSSLNAPSIRAVNEGLSKIIESGDGYIKYENGDMVCYGISQISAAINNAWGSGYYGSVSSATLPKFSQTFIDVPLVVANINTTGNLGIIAGINASTTQMTRVFIVAFNSVASYNEKLYWEARGKWKSDVQTTSDEPSSEETTSDEQISDEETI